MSKQIPAPDDDLLRAALRAEADDVEAGPDLLDRIHAASGESRRPRRSAWLLVAAALVAVAGLATILVIEDDDAQRVDVVEDPVAPTSTSPPTTVPSDVSELLSTQYPCRAGEEIHLAVYLEPTVADADRMSMAALLEADIRVASVRYVGREETYERFQELFADQPELVATVTPEILPTAYLVGLVDPAQETDLRSEVADHPGVYALAGGIGCELKDAARELPTLLVLVRENGQLVSIDLPSGDERELAVLADPRATVQGGRNAIQSVSLSPDGAWVYFGSCCPPSQRLGDVWRVPVDGSTPAVRIAAGYDPAADPSGNLLAIADPVEGHLWITGLDGEIRHELSATVAVAEPDWSPDGRRLAFTDQAIDGGRVMVVDFDPETGFGTPRRLAGVTEEPTWLTNDTLMALDRSGSPTQIVRLVGDGTVLDRGPLASPVSDLATSRDRRFVLGVNVDGSVVIQYAAAPPGAGVGAFARRAIAADW
ncbi:MAG: permease-like cell division protein FtsX [Acidimicrobiales bacterium]